MFRTAIILSFCTVLFACNSTRKVTFNPPTEEEYELRQLDTLEITASPISAEEAAEEQAKGYYHNVYRASHTRKNDLLHTKLELRFDWEKEEVLGVAHLRLTPYFFPINQVTLDAKNFLLHAVRFEKEGEDLNYSYDQEQVTINLGKTFKKGETYNLYIEYTAQPRKTGGSDAITSDQGLFFIKSGDKPVQIWTQGETEWNSRWFPTIDKPNERCTQEMYLTVQDRFTTLSNGLLVSSNDNADGTRTDYWKMDMPHAPYLFMVAVGEHAVVKESWEDTPLEYYVDPEYKSDAKNIFAHTPEMLTFFSDKFGLKYPWQKYSQIVVKDYVSGAMENTTAVIFGDFVQRTARELADEHNDNIVAHELAHHWFGDYVTCESWSNLTLNEGFANYSEYLWLEYKYGKEEADYFMYSERDDYLFSARNETHPLIEFEYEDKEDMFDAHSYNKGGAVMHMLRNYVGDQAFFAGTQKYLQDNALQAVEAHDLRLAFEAVTGEDLNWFFNQWFFDKGHPELDITYGYNKKQNQATVKVEQIQSPDDALEVFELPVAIDIFYADGTSERKQVWINKRRQTFQFPVQEQPALINFDPEKVLLSRRWNNKSVEQYAFQYRHCSSVLDRIIAVENLADNPSELSSTILLEALQDSFWVVRIKAINATVLDTPEKIKQVQQLALEDTDYAVRNTALVSLMELEDKKSSAAIAEQLLQKEKSYTVIASALRLLEAYDKQAVLPYAEKLESEKSSEVLEAISRIYGESGNAKYLPFYEKNIDQVDGFESIAFADYYQSILSQIDIDQAINSLQKIKAKALDINKSPWQKLAIANAINNMRNEYRKRANKSKESRTKELLESQVEKISAMLDEIRSSETNERLKSLYDQYQLIDKS